MNFLAVCKVCGAPLSEDCACLGRPNSKELTVTILRPSLFFAKGDVVTVKKFREYFTYEAMKRMAEDEFIFVEYI